jgi:hypothetical protein
VSTSGTLYLNLAGRLPAGATIGAFRHVSAHAGAITRLALAGLGAVGVRLVVVHVTERRTSIPHGTGVGSNGLGRMAWVEWP